VLRIPIFYHPSGHPIAAPFFFFFGWACWVNWKTSQQTPDFYLEYGELSWSGWYRTFILGWFADHFKLAVGFIASW
jgi:hypothetical protein